MQRDEDARGDQGAAERELESGGATRPAERKPGAGELSAADPGATETDGKGTGATGQDAGGYGTVPGSEATG